MISNLGGIPRWSGTLALGFQDFLILILIKLIKQLELIKLLVLTTISKSIDVWKHNYVNKCYAPREDVLPHQFRNKIAQIPQSFLVSSFGIIFFDSCFRNTLGSGWDVCAGVYILALSRTLNLTLTLGHWLDCCSLAQRVIFHESWRNPTKSMRYDFVSVLMGRSIRVHKAGACTRAVYRGSITITGLRERDKWKSVTHPKADAEPRRSDLGSLVDKFLYLPRSYPQSIAGKGFLQSASAATAYATVPVA